MSPVTRLIDWTLVHDDAYRRARAVQRILTERGEHRSAGPVDLLVAATAELSGLTVLHYDADFETVAVRGRDRAALVPPRRDMVRGAVRHHMTSA